MLVEDQAEVRSVSDIVDPVVETTVPPDDEIMVELGIWLSGIESFLVDGHHSFAGGIDPRSSGDATKVSGPL